MTVSVDSATVVRYFPDSKIRCPDFFIVGAPKCGTSALASYLAAHPRIYFTEPKEPHYFNTDMANRHTRDESTYRSYFADANDNHLAVGEGSVLYLFSEAAIPAIRARFPAARYIVMLRNPLDMAPSWYSEAVFSSVVGETAASFEDAWHLLTARARGEQVPAICREPKVLQYDRVCALGTQLARLYAAAPLDQVLVVFQEDLARDPRGEYLRVLAFLGVPDDGRLDFAQVNTAKALAAPRLFHGYVHMRAVIKRLLRTRVNLGLGNALRTSITRARSKTTVENDVRAEMLTVFEPEIARLEMLTGRDLSHWRR